MAVEKGVSRTPWYIFELSTDLILSIFDFLDLESHFDFACTSKQLYQASSRVRKRHEDAYRKYKVISDLHPTTVPTLLRSAFGYSDPIPAWHVRSFEIWRDRKNWSEWKPLSFDTPIDQDTETEAINWTYNHWELNDYVQTVECWDDENIVLHEAQVQIEQGYDGFLKALLIAKCPRLKDVKFVASCKFEEHEPRSCFSWLKGFITASVVECQPWLRGLETLQRVAVCPLSDTWMDQDSRIRNQWWSLLQLPQIDYLYVNNPYVFPVREEYIRPDLYTSSLKHLFFDNLHFGRQSPIKNALIGVPETLISAAFRMTVWSRWEPSLELIEDVAMYHRTTLQSLMLYGPHWIDEHAIAPRICGPENLEDFQNLRHVCISIDEIWESALRREGDTASTDADSEARERYAPYYEEDFPSAFPESMETLTLWGNREDDLDGPRALIGLGKGLAKLIECGRYENLKAVYLEEIEQNFKDPHNSDPWGLATAVEAGKSHNVDVYSVRNAHEEKLHNNIAFPEGVEKWDLQTGPWIKPEGLVFNNYLGRRVAKSSESCGECERCCGPKMKELDVGIEEYKSIRGPRVRVERKVVEE